MSKLNAQLKAMQTELTEYVVSQLEAGLTWSKCWEASAAQGLPFSTSTGKAYSGSNVFWLWATAQMKGFTSSEWGTYNAWKKAGGNVRKGEKATKIMFYKPIFKEENGEQVFSHAALRAYSLFNRDQVDGLPVVMPKTDNGVKCDAGALFQYTEAQNIKISYANYAAYNYQLDRIILPKSYTQEAGGWSTVAHEIIHSTGHKSRLDSTMSQAKHEYSYEELIAELGALFLCSQLGLATDESKEQSAAYCAHWAQVLKANPAMLWKAAGDASKACEFVNKSLKVEEAAA
jgi:antirestriction protein ArdC